MSASKIVIYTIQNGSYDFRKEDISLNETEQFLQYNELFSSGVNNNIVKLRGMKVDGDEFETLTYIVLPEKIEKEISIEFVGSEEIECGCSVIESISWSDVIACVGSSKYFEEMSPLKQFMFDEICRDIADYVCFLQDKEENDGKLSKKEGKFVDTYLNLTDSADDEYDDEYDDEDEEKQPMDFFIEAEEFTEDALNVLTSYFNIESCYKNTFAKITSIMDQYISYFEEKIHGFIMTMDEDSVSFRPREEKKNEKRKGKFN